MNKSCSKMATKNCPKCDTPNPVACKKCVCGHVFFASRRSANSLPSVENYDDDPAFHPEPEVPRRRTARVTRERPQFYDALQVENQSRRQRELQKRRKASKSDEQEGATEEVSVEKPTTSSAPSAKRRAESPPAKVAEPPVKKRRGRPPALSGRKPGRAQILSKSSDANSKSQAMALAADDASAYAEDVHDVPPFKALQMNMVLSDINSRITSSGVRVENVVYPAVSEMDMDMEIEPDGKKGKTDDKKLRNGAKTLKNEKHCTSTIGTEKANESEARKKKSIDKDLGVEDESKGAQKCDTEGKGRVSSEGQDKDIPQDLDTDVIKNDESNDTNESDDGKSDEGKAKGEDDSCSGAETKDTTMEIQDGVKAEEEKEKTILETKDDSPAEPMDDKARESNVEMSVENKETVVESNTDKTLEIEAKKENEMDVKEVESPTEPKKERQLESKKDKTLVLEEENLEQGIKEDCDSKDNTSMKANDDNKVDSVNQMKNDDIKKEPEIETSGDLATKNDVSKTGGSTEDVKLTAEAIQPAEKNVCEDTGAKGECSATEEKVDSLNENHKAEEQAKTLKNEHAVADQTEEEKSEKTKVSEVED